MRALINILPTIQPVIEQARWVAIDDIAIRRTAAHLADAGAPLPDWGQELHPVGRDEAETATLVLVLDVLNFCFWPLPGRPLGARGKRWNVAYKGESYDGYMALAVALRKAVETGAPLADPEYLCGLDLGQVRELLAPEPGSQEIPLIAARLAHLREAGQALRERWDGSFATPILAAGGSAAALIDEVLAALPSFRDTAVYRGHEVRFYKRAQILTADLHGALHGGGLGAFHDLDQLTAFADYKVPQILRQFGMLRYRPELVQSIAGYELIPPGDEREVEIRAATIWAVELLRQALAERGRSLPACELDWLLWNAAQTLPADAEPYHRTLTVYY